MLPSFFHFALPVFLALVLQALYGAVDLWAVGKFGSTSDISAVSTGSQTMQIVTGMVTGLSMGTTILLGRCVGKKDRDGASRVVGASIQIFTILGVLLSLTMAFCAKPIAVMMHAPGEAFERTVSYIRISGSGTICIAAYNLLSAIFRGIGDSRSPLLFVFVACITNIVGDTILIAFFHMGARGAAIATVAAQAVSVVLSLALIRKKGLPFPLRKEHFAWQHGTVKAIVRLGSPIALQDTCNEISYLVIIGLVNVLGVTASAGVGIAEKLVIFVLLIPVTYMHTISAFVAQNCGAGKMARARKALALGVASAAVMGGFVAYLFYCHGDSLSLLFVRRGNVSNPMVVKASAEFLKATSIECFLLSIVYCLTGYCNGIGKTTFVMVQGLAATFLVKVPYAFLASRSQNPKLFRISLSSAWAALFSLVVCCIYFLVRRQRSMAKERNDLNAWRKASAMGREKGEDYHDKIS